MRSAGPLPPWGSEKSTARTDTLDDNWMAGIAAIVVAL